MKIKISLKMIFTILETENFYYLYKENSDKRD